jgi:single-strand DNA-binding protein
MRSVNKVLLMGHLATQPEMKMTTSGHTVTTFKLATNRDSVTKEGETKPVADFHKIVAWRKLGEACGEYLKKGSGVYVEGHLSNHKFQDKEGKNRKSTEVIADTVNFISIKKSKNAEEVTLLDVPA